MPGHESANEYSAPSLLALLSAVRNGSSLPLTPDLILRILSGKDGDPSHMRALFGDVSLAALDGAAATRETAAAANLELDAALDERAGWRRG